MLVPYYHHRFASSYFQKKGWRGLLVRVLNYLRWRLQRACEYQVMILLAKRHGVGDKSTITALKARWHEENQEARQKRTTLSVLGQAEVQFSGEKKERYAEGRRDLHVADETQVQMARSIARAQSRTGRYVNGEPTFGDVELEPMNE